VQVRGEVRTVITNRRRLLADLVIMSLGIRPNSALAEKGNGRLLGGQIIGQEGSAKRIDVLATALHSGLTVEEMINSDLGCDYPL